MAILQQKFSSNQSKENIFQLFLFFFKKYYEYSLFQIIQKKITQEELIARLTISPTLGGTSPHPSRHSDIGGSQFCKCDLSIHLK
jgi:hypothetical protein